MSFWTRRPHIRNATASITSPVKPIHATRSGSGTFLTWLPFHSGRSNPVARLTIRSTPSNPGWSSTTYVEYQGHPDSSLSARYVGLARSVEDDHGDHAVNRIPNPINS